MPMPCEVTHHPKHKECKICECEVEVCCEDDMLCVTGDVLNDLRQAIIGELGAIIEYGEAFKRWKEKCPEAAKLFCDNMNDEKMHVAQLTALINKLDPAQAKFFREVGCPFQG